MNKFVRRSLEIRQMQIVTKRSLWDHEVALIGVVNKLNRFSAFVYSLNEPLSGVCGYFYIILLAGRATFGLAGAAAAVSRYIE